MTINSLASYNRSLGTEPNWVSFQLNTFLAFDFSGSRYVYWVQDVLEINTSAASVEFFDNIWNASSPTVSTLPAGGVTGGGSIQRFLGESYYADGASCPLPGACVTLSYPATLTLEMNASVGLRGSPTVAFRYDDGRGLITYDTATFAFARAVASPPEFEVDAGMFSPSCPRCYGDVELVAGGPDSGYDTTLSGPTDVLLSLQEWNGNNYQAVPAAFDYGISTGEGLQNASESVLAGLGGVPEAQLTNGAGTTGPLWGPGSTSDIEVSVATGSSSGSLQLNGSSSVPFAGTFVSVVVLPGNYSVNVTSGGSPYSLGTVALMGGEELTLEIGAPAVVFVPQGLPGGTVWTVVLNGQILHGTGNLTFGETAGNYTYTVQSVSGYDPTPSSGSLSVPPNGTIVLVQWSAAPVGLLAQLVAFLLDHLVVLGAIVLLALLVGAIASTARSRRQSRTLRPAAPGRAPFAVTRPAPRSPARAFCPHCGAPRPFGFASCARCGWRPPTPPSYP